MLRIPGLYIQHHPAMGRGVHTSQTINAEDIIEVCPIIKIPKEDLALIHKTTLHDYYFLWGDTHDEAAIALGYGSIYNHHPEANAKVILDYNQNEIIIQATKTIEVTDQIFINYNDGDTKNIALWFDVK